MLTPFTSQTYKINPYTKFQQHKTDTNIYYYFWQLDIVCNDSAGVCDALGSFPAV